MWYKMINFSIVRLSTELGGERVGDMSSPLQRNESNNLSHGSDCKFVFLILNLSLGQSRADKTQSTGPE